MGVHQKRDSNDMYDADTPRGASELATPIAAVSLLPNPSSLPPRMSLPRSALGECGNVLVRRLAPYSYIRTVDCTIVLILEAADQG